MQVRLLYVSSAVGPQTTTVTGSILKSARAFNQAHDITGVLCQGQGLFLQMLEGQRSTVNRLYARILADQRHKDVQLLDYEEISVRRFGAWAMAHVQLSALDPMIQMQHPEFDPYSASGKLVLSELDELIAAGQILDELPQD
ncbi:MAG: BLUF domain-containing protein [Betaproteobacteria bacterium]